MPWTTLRAEVAPRRCGNHDHNGNLCAPTLPVSPYYPNPYAETDPIRTKTNPSSASDEFIVRFVLRLVLDYA